MAGLVPIPRRRLDPVIVTLPAGTRLWRVHAGTSAPLEFSVSSRETRFGPLSASDGARIPIWYGASDEEGAVFESVFHDVPIGAAHPQVLYAEFAARLLSPLVTTSELRLVDLTSEGLRRLRVQRTQLIETTSKQYPRTRKWAEALRESDPESAGLWWVARLHDTSQAVVLFGDRVAPGAIIEDESALAPIPLGIGRGLDLVERLAVRADITIVFP